jgi:hypothetical protein
MTAGCWSAGSLTAGIYGDIAVRLAVPRGVLVDRVHRLRTDLRRKAKALGT